MRCAHSRVCGVYTVVYAVCTQSLPAFTSFSFPSHLLSCSPSPRTAWQAQALTTHAHMRMLQCHQYSSSAPYRREGEGVDVSAACLVTQLLLLRYAVHQLRVVGLCRTCRHARVQASRQGSRSRLAAAVRCLVVRLSCKGCSFQVYPSCFIPLVSSPLPHAAAVSQDLGEVDIGIVAEALQVSSCLRQLRASSWRFLSLCSMCRVSCVLVRVCARVSWDQTA